MKDTIWVPLLNRRARFTMRNPGPNKSPLVWRQVGEGGAFASWVRELEGKNGVYAIRDASSGAILYVGESHKGRLYETMSRHFQSWGGKTAGPTYDRRRVEVAFRITRAAVAVTTQNRLIRRLEPRDNRYGYGSEEPVPF